MRTIACIDGKRRPATPEERVRQWIAALLVDRLGYTVDDMRIEFPIQAFSSTRRVDIAAFRRVPGERFAQDNVFMIVECKRAGISDDEFAAAERQAGAYLSAVLRAEFCVVTDGSRVRVTRKVCEIVDGEPGDWAFIRELHIPHAERSVGPPRFAVVREEPLLKAYLTLELHACLRAELDAMPERSDQIMARYGVDELCKMEADEYFASLCDDDELRRVWNEAYEARAKSLDACAPCRR